MMFHKLLSFKRSCDTFTPLRTLIRGINTTKKYSRGENVHSCPSLINFLCENRFLSVWQYRCQAPVMSCLSCKRNFSSDKLVLARRDGLSRRSTKFLEFHDRITNQEGDFTMSLSEWENLENEILTESPNLAPGLDYSIMKTLSSKPDMSASFMRYIKSKRQPNVPVLTEFFMNCAEKYEDFVLEEFEQLMETCDLNKLYTKRNKIAEGIAKTREWRRSVDLLDLSLTAPGVHQLPTGAIAASAEVLKQTLKHGDYDTFFKVWSKFSQVKILTEMEILSNMFFNTWEEGLIPFDVFIELLKLEELPLQEAQSRDVQRYCQGEWQNTATARASSVNMTSRKCSSCRGLVPERELIEESVFQKMGKEIFHKMLIGENIFRKTNPKELENFSNFMTSQKYPFDYIIDGLNLIFMTREGDKFLLDTLKRLSAEGNRVLVITKQRVRLEAQYKKYAALFSLNPKSYDDCYMMLAAFLSGPQCYVVTNDDFRDHIAVVESSLRPYFLQWRDQNRIFHRHNSLYYPPKYRWTAHENETGWHIPCRKPLKIYSPANANVAYTLTDYKTRAFLCIRKLKYTPSSELIQFRKSKSSHVNTKLDDEVT